ncbi:MAG: LLM class F420-dependent oxidoreductase [Alphaproteobacteria bacterium]|nr:LLM class F420-dependent oxidoreductase [Alphaproteobacteria bacterium]
MQFGFGVPHRGANANPATITAMARQGEALGYDWLTVSDHVVIPRQIESKYPYSDGGNFPGQAGGDCMDQVTLLSFLAAQTSKIRLLTSVMVVPHRPAVVTAKMLATVDLLSNGRVTVGCGAGWMREEFAAIQAPDYDRRGAVTEEYIRAFKTLWTEDNPAFDGEFVKFRDIVFLPKPVQKPHPPIWIGGESGPALRRAARVADGWYPIGYNPRFPLDTAPRFAGRLARLRRYAAEAGRDPDSITLAYNANWAMDGNEIKTDTGERRLLSGSTQALVDDAGKLAELGVEHLIVNVQAETIAATVERMERFAREVKARI